MYLDEDGFDMHDKDYWTWHSTDMPHSHFVFDDTDNHIVHSVFGKLPKPHYTIT